VQSCGEAICAGKDKRKCEKSSTCWVDAVESLLGTNIEITIKAVEEMVK